MNLTNSGAVRHLCKKYGFTFSKGLGQNFIMDPSVCEKMADHCATTGIGILEIGPGFGSLTQKLAQKVEKVVAIELDERLLPVLDETLCGFQNVEIVHGDIMKINISTLISEKFEGLQVAVCANLPYYITTPVIMRLLEQNLPIRSVTVMVQKEVADRLCAKECSRATSAVTLAVRFFSQPRVLFSVPKEKFFPSPTVDSAVVSLEVREEPPVSVSDQKFFFKVIKAAFSQRRKTAVNAISTGLAIEKSTVFENFMRAGLPSTARAEELSLENFATLSGLLQNFSVKPAAAGAPQVQPRSPKP